MNDNVNSPTVSEHLVSWGIRYSCCIIIRQCLKPFAFNGRKLPKKAELEGVLAEKQNQYSTQQQNIQVISSYKFDFNSTSEEQSAEKAVEEYMVDLTKYFKNVDTETLNKMTKINQSIYNGAVIPKSLTNISMIFN